MTSATLNTAEKSLLQYWLADGAPGYSTVVVNANNQRQNKPLQASDYAAIAALDNDVVRGYLTNYQTQKLAALATAATTNAANAARITAGATALATETAAIKAVTVQTVPTSA